ncbi:LapD/MoxY N-terminal periplasmic domain-containing protein [Idiomarina sp. Sol25]|uniref:bifunctional diguanylate cyclase/phosphodiesterase n=1 Tax=Idiomarina sp. Sol25 TaxID=3064000 RepID=UPI00294B7D46|nr:LapD/MoxY N-terminal periplasmic domain-containing protein [Idiomarina sp. Sol25]MDV6328458.1 LapD/MoxY N-terminal periplasmic domain-containing protein [Idiomarina sp. Sol25]
MTLNRQIWYVLVAVVLISFFTSFIVTSLSATRFIEQQLTTENTNSANMLAQTLSNNSKDPALLELTISAQFDTGFYESIRLTNTQGDVIVERSFDNSSTGEVPGWFASWFDLEVPAGEALVQDGWNQFGMVSVQSQKRHALETLWSRAITLFVIALSTAVLAGLCGRALLRNVTRPLNLVVQQAEAIGQGRYITNKKSPKTKDLKKLVQAMNKMSEQIRMQFQKELRKLSQLQARLYKDQDTGVYNRSFVLERLSAHFGVREERLPAVMLMLHLDKLADLNKSFGRKNVDNYIKAIADKLSGQAESIEQELSCKVTVARMNASDFGLLFENVADVEQLERKINDCVSTIQVHEKTQLDAQANWYASADFTVADETVGQLLMRLDEKITNAEARPTDNNTALILSHTKNSAPLFTDKQQWSQTFQDALEHDKVQLNFRSTKDRSGNLVHLENSLCLEINGHILNGHQFIPWAQRLEFLSALELKAIEKAMLFSAENNSDIAMNLSINFLQSVPARAQLMKSIQQYKKACDPANLWFELNEFEVHSQQKLFADFCFSMKRMGCHVGLQGCTHIFDYMYDIETFGLDYLKVDRSITQAIPQNAGEVEDSIPAKMCQLGQSLGIKMFAEGVDNEADIESVLAAGFDGYTSKT